MRDQNTFAESLRRKRLMTLVHLFLVHRFKAESVHYVTPNEDNQYQVAKMKSHDIFREVNTEVGQIIVADVDHQRISELLAPDQTALGKLICRERKGSETTCGRSARSTNELFRQHYAAAARQPDNCAPGSCV